MTFQQKLDIRSQKQKTLLCVGLDSDMTKMPKFFQNQEHAQFEFNKAIISATHDLVCAYKPNTAFYESRGAEGIIDLKLTCDYIRQQYPEIPIILDAKRADIGNTNEGYVKFAYDYLETDALTVHPYLGKEALLPFLNLKDKGCIILCRTSNSGARELQDVEIQGVPYYQMLAQKISHDWNLNHNCLLVVGATYPEELRIVRSIVGDMTILVPGIGARGGDTEAILKAGLNSLKRGLIINSSRGIIFASNGNDFADKAREEAMKLKNTIQQYR